MEQARAEGYTFIDVRPAEEFKDYHAPNSLNVPLFGPIIMDSPSKMMKQLLYSFNGMKGTDENVRFLEQARAASARAYLGARSSARGRAARAGRGAHA